MTRARSEPRRTYPILIGLFGIFASGWLALVMARGQEAVRTGVRLTETWVVPTSGLVMMACGGVRADRVPAR